MEEYKRDIAELQKLMDSLGGVNDLSPIEREKVLETAEVMLSKYSESEVNTQEFSRLRVMLKVSRFFKRYDEFYEAHGKLTDYMENYEKDPRVIFYTLVHLLLDYGWNTSGGNIKGMMTVLEAAINEGLKDCYERDKPTAN
jgi:hypothetical protein